MDETNKCFEVAAGTADSVNEGSTDDVLNEDEAKGKDKRGKVKVGCVLYGTEETKGDVREYCDAAIVNGDSVTVWCTLDDA